jgi:hypothetical protein
LTPISDVPEFAPPPSSTAVGVEGESLTVAMKATGNPMSIAYTWTKDGRPIVPTNGNILFIHASTIFFSLNCVGFMYCLLAWPHKLWISSHLTGGEGEHKSPRQKKSTHTQTGKVKICAKIIITFVS